jgi:hypothetical protein
MIKSLKFHRIGQFKGFLFIAAVIIILMVLFYTQYLVEQIRSEARHSLSMNIEHYRFLLDKGSPVDAFEEIRRIDIPLVLADDKGQPKFWKNIGIDPNDTTVVALEKVKSIIARMDRKSQPIPLKYAEGVVDYFHYGDSSLISELRLFPFVSIIVVGVFIMIGYLGFKYIKDSEQRFVWVGMARETAHQLGTPLSSLLGWMELLKAGQGESSLYVEMDKDIARLEKITARFSHIGSEVKLPPTPLLPVVQESVNYYRRRIPKTGKKIEIFEEYRAEPVINLNPYLLGWVVENLIRNGIDAIASDSGAITVTVSETSKKVLIDISDTGCGIETKHFRNIFRPGFTTKNRGWGVGLSLAKRIVQDYHNGKISIKESMLDKGTTMRITLPKGD